MELLFTGSPSKYTVKEAYDQCTNLAKNHYENFTVGSWFLPQVYRKHIYAIYAYCRFVDDLGDEQAGDRLKALDAWESDLLACYNGTPQHPYMVALQQTIREFDIPKEPFLRLIKANRIDQTVTQYATYSDIEHYCQHSANPVGHLVLYVFGYRDKERQNLSNYTCTALQLVNFWQDVSRDYGKGRIYIPIEDMERFGYSKNDLSNSLFTNRFQDLMAFEVDRTRELFKLGMPLIDTLEGQLKLDIALFSQGGIKMLKAIEDQGYNVLNHRPKLSRITIVNLMLITIIKLRLGLEL